MKLVEILAEKLDDWADTTVCYAQDGDGYIYPWLGRPKMIEFEWLLEDPCGSLMLDSNTSATHLRASLTSDWGEALVTKEMWLAEKGKRGGDGTQSLTTGGGTMARHMITEITPIFTEKALTLYGTYELEGRNLRISVGEDVVDGERTVVVLGSDIVNGIQYVLGVYKTEEEEGAMTGHIHAESMKLYAEDAAETERPWERWQTRFEGEVYWVPLAVSPVWNTDKEYRRKPTTITIGGEEVPEPVREPLKRGEPYWVASTDRADLSCSSQWDCDGTDMTRLRLGLVHRSKEAAVAHTKALIKVSGGEV